MMRAPATSLVALAAVLLLLGLLRGHAGVQAFYLPGVAPHDFEEEEQVDLKVNKLSSVHTQIPLDYYSLAFCQPQEGIKLYSENLGELLFGDRIENSAYEVYMLEEAFCRVLCQKTFSEKEASKFVKAIKRQYHHNWIMDNLPAASIVDSDDYYTTQYVGFPVGYEKNDEHYIFNHVNIVVEYHPVETGNRVVGFYVQPFSVKHRFDGGQQWDGENREFLPALETCPGEDKHMRYDTVADHQKVEAGTPTVFTYDVEWKPSNVRWASRWDIYLSMNHKIPPRIHWFSIINSLLILVFLSGMIALIMVRTLHRDIARYNRVLTDEEKEEEKEESGWKLVHADVFRPPVQYAMFFCVCVGTGVQVFSMCLLTVFFAAIGFLSPANRGSLMIAFLMFYVMLSSVAGYTSARLYKTFKGKQWQRCTLLTALVFPGMCCLVFFVLNFVVLSYGSTGAVPFTTMLAVLFLWFGISVPLVFLGAFFGYKRDGIKYPVVTSNIPRQIPTQPWWLAPGVTILAGGILPFCATYVEIYFILSSIWMDQYYYVFGFLLIVFGILTLTCAEIAIVQCYFQLCAEDYEWWWRSFLVAGSTAFYVFLTSALFYTRLEGAMVITSFLYFSYMGMICVGLFLMTGSVGFLACLWFNRTVFSAIKVD